MLSVRPAVALIACVLILTVACLPLSAQVLSPSSRTSAESTAKVTLKGYAPSPGEKVTINAVDQNTGNFVLLGTAMAAMSGDTFRVPSKRRLGATYKLYPWTYEAGVPAAKYWSPQSIVADLMTSQGHLELQASTAPNNILETFSQPAFSALQAVHSPDFSRAAQLHTDGHTTVRFDQDGVNSGPASNWANVQGMVSVPPSGGYLSVAWSVGSYTVEGNKTIYALICSPATGGPYPVVIYNHGGILGLGNLHGAVTAAGWTTPPTGTSDDLGQCIDWAKRGWVFAMSSYRNESIAITSSSSEFQTGTWTSQGNPEFCLGEVTDVMGLADLLLHHTSTIKVGDPAHPKQIKVSDKVFMYGWSHGGCITYRAVEQGAPVNAFVVVEGFTDVRLGYLDGLGIGLTAEQAAAGSGAYQWLVSYYLPDAAGVMGYNWRSAHYFASRGDLSIEKFKTMPILIFHGDVDINPDVGPTDPAKYNPVFLDQPVAIATDIGATKIFVGPAALAPTSASCISGTVGAPIVDSTTQQPLAPLGSCPVLFTAMDTADPCVSVSTVPAQLPKCSTVLQLPLTAPSGQSQQLHYLVVYHNMDHFNGGLAIQAQFGRFVEQNFGTQPGCDGVAIVCNAN